MRHIKNTKWYQNRSIEDISILVNGVLYTEQWKEVDGHGGHYQISSFGRVKTKERFCIRSVNGNCIRKTKINKLTRNKKGYIVTGFYFEGKRVQCRINRLVATYFILNPNNKEEVNHIDADKENNFYLNLEWSTRIENMDHASKNKLMRPRKGGDVHTAKLVLDTQTGIFYYSIKEAAKAKNVNYDNLIKKLSGALKNNNTSIIYA